MLEVMNYFRANGFKRILSPNSARILCAYMHNRSRHSTGTGDGLALAVKYAYAKDGKPVLIKEPRLMLDDNHAASRRASPDERRRPNAAFGNSTGDRQMLEYTGAGAASV